MKLLHNLLVSAACVAALVASTATPTSAQAAEVDSRITQATSKLLRGLEQNYDDAKLLPGPPETGNVSELIPAAAEELGPEPVVDAGQEFEADPAPVDEENYDEPEVAPTTLGATDDDNWELIQVEGAEDTFQLELTQDDYPSEYNRRLRSWVDPAFAQIHLAEPTPLLEKVTPPSEPKDTPTFTELSGAKPALRGPEPGKR
ncbi:hypothetical protein PHYPSEUDO_010859 [Phytophthora pseudosyringae]|uniref:RxLR effector protein n=1 Tax=Phytophthora pseudosyringae TaxID=221518 RepID=A0A8T1VCA7_9STRA|nr:hypothetical protein PHYPSEUDO_010859 [Phytophthora pseudosyringae]